MAVTESIGSPGDPVAVEPRDLQRARARVVPIATDERLARQVARDERAFIAIYERYHQTLYRYCRALLRDDTDAQDAAQSTWTRALIALRRGKRDAPLSPWLFRIAHNESISQVRRRARQRTTCEDEDTHELAEAASAEQQAIDREQFTQLVDDLHELPDRLRGALLMRELAGFSHDEIATSLGTSVGAAKQSILEARRGLQEFAAGRALVCDEVTRRVSDGDRRALRGRQIRAHLRACEPCSEFAAAIEGRRRTLRAFAPTLAAPAAAAGLAHALGAGGVGAGATGATATGVSTGAATTAALGGAGAPSGAVVAVAGKSAGAALVTKALASVAVVVAAGATAHALAGNARHHPRGAAGDRHRAAASGTRAVPAQGGAGHHDAVAAVGVPDRHGAHASIQAVAGASRARSKAAGHRLTAAAPVTGRRHRGGAAEHRLPTSVPAPRRIPSQRIHITVWPTHDPAHPARQPLGPTHTPATPTHGPATPTHTPPGQSQTAPGQSQTPPAQTPTPADPTHTSPGHVYIAPGRGGTPPGHTHVVPGQDGSPPGQTDTTQGGSDTPGHIATAPTQIDDPPGHTHLIPRHVHTPLGQTTTSPGQTETPPGDTDTSPTQSETPPAASGTLSTPTTVTSPTTPSPTTPSPTTTSGPGNGNGPKKFSK